MKNHFINSLFLMILGYHCSEKNYGRKTNWLGSSIDISSKNRNFRSKTSFRAWEVQLLSKLKNPSLNHAQSVACSIKWASQMRPWLRPFLAGLYAFFENRSEFGKNGQKISGYELKIWEIFLKSQRFLPPETFLGNRLKVEIYTDACEKSPSESDSINWDSGIGIG